MIVIEWLTHHYIEFAGVITGVIFIIFSIRQNPVCWPFGIVSSALYIFVYFHTRLYANSGLQVYYLVMGVYGWYFWKKSDNAEGGDEKNANAKYMSAKTLIFSLLTILLLEAPVFWLLKNHTDSPYPAMDSITTTFSILATWMLARKYIENWIIWIITDGLAVGLYVYMGLYATAGLYLVYTILAVAGFWEWKKEIISMKISESN